MSVMALLTPAIQASDGPIAAAHDGQRGFWVPRELFIQMEAAYEDNPRAKAQIKAQRAQIHQLHLSFRAKADTASTAMERRDFYKEAYLEERTAHFQANADALEASKRSLWEEPALWFLLGVGGTALVEILRKDSPTVIVTPDVR